MRQRLSFAAPVAVLLVLSMGASTASAAGEEAKMQRSITISASGMAAAAPDQARISTGVVSEASTARDALTANSAAMQKAIAELKAKGIDAKDIQTSSFNVEPITVYGKDGQAPRITGYRVSNQVSLLVRDLGKLGDVLDHLVSAGANQASNLQFEVSKAETLKDEARKEAMDNALRRAKLLAEAGGAKIGQVLQISEEVASQGPRPFATARLAKAESVPIEAGESTLEARVTVTWALE